MVIGGDKRLVMYSITLLTGLKHPGGGSLRSTSL